MKPLLVLSISCLATFCVVSCHNEPEEAGAGNPVDSALSSPTREPTELETVYARVEKAVDVAIRYRKSDTTELEGLYPLQKSRVPIDEDELFLVKTLKKRGFSVIGWGKEQIGDGPHITGYYLKKDGCFCEADKLYYATPGKEFRVTERIRCTDSLTFYGK